MDFYSLISIPLVIIILLTVLCIILMVPLLFMALLTTLVFVCLSLLIVTLEALMKVDECSMIWQMSNDGYPAYPCLWPMQNTSRDIALITSMLSQCFWPGDLDNDFEPSLTEYVSTHAITKEGREYDWISLSSASIDNPKNLYPFMLQEIRCLIFPCSWPGDLDNDVEPSLTEHVSTHTITSKCESPAGRDYDSISLSSERGSTQSEVSKSLGKKGKQKKTSHKVTSLASERGSTQSEVSKSLGKKGRQKKTSHKGTSLARIFNVATIKRTFSWFFPLFALISFSGVCLSSAQENGIVVYKNTARLTTGEINGMSSMIAAEWNHLAALMNIPYYEQEKIRFNHTKYPSLRSKAIKVLELFNASEFFSRTDLKKYFKELGPCDVESQMHPFENEVLSANTSQNETIVNDETPLSPREIYRISHSIGVEWDILGGLMGVSKEERMDIGSNSNYHDHCSRAEKILSIVTNKKVFKREALTRCFEEMQKLEILKIATIKQPCSWCTPSCLPSAQENGIVVYKNTARLTTREVNGMSSMIGAEWSRLAGLMNIPYYEQEEIRFDHTLYPTLPSKAEKVLVLFNASESFSRTVLKKHFEELGRHDVECQMHPFEKEVLSTNTSLNETIVNDGTPLSSREMYTLSRRIGVKWDALGGLMGVSKEERMDIGYNSNYHDHCSRAEKILWIVTNKEGFSREELARCFEEMQKLDERGSTQSEVSKSLGKKRRQKETSHTGTSLASERGSAQSEVTKSLSKKAKGRQKKTSHKGTSSARILNVATTKRTFSWFIPLFALTFFSGACLPSAKENGIVVYNNTTKLTTGEINGMSSMIGVEWSRLAGLMNIPYYEQEKIRFNHTLYPSLRSKAKKVLVLFNASKFFSRTDLEKYFKELGRCDVERQMHPFEKDLEVLSTNTSQNETVVNDETPLSPREMYTVSRCIGVEWDTLGGLMGISKEERMDIRYNSNYHDHCSRAEKILSIVTNKEGFSREALARCFEEMQKLEILKIATIKRPCSWCIPSCLRMAQENGIVVYKNTTRLTTGEISGMGSMIGAEWNRLAALMNIPYYEQEKIRFNHTLYPTLSSKAKKVLVLFNASEFFSRTDLKKHFKELGRYDVELQMHPFKKKVLSTNTSQNETIVSDETPLSPREMYRISLRVGVKWNTFGGLMGISKERIDIGSNINYHEHCSRAEKILSIVTNKEGFSREALARCFEEMQKLELSKPVRDGLWRM